MTRDTKQVLHKFEKQLTTAIFNEPALGLKGAQTTRITEIATTIAEHTFTASSTPIPTQLDPMLVADFLRKANLSSQGNAECLELLHGPKLRYDHKRGLWLIWNGEVWEEATKGQAERHAVDTLRARYEAGGAIEDADQRKKFASFVINSENARNVRQMLESAGNLPQLASSIEEWDANPWLANAGSVTLDLRKGEAKPNTQADYITKRLGTQYAPQAKCPQWEKFLAEVFDGNAEMIAYAQRAAGYSYTGDVSEQVLFLCYGGGANGKSVFLNILGHLAGDYAGNTSFDTLDPDSREGRSDLAKLKGTRLVTIIETEEDRRLAEARVKYITGKDRVITARALYERPFDYHVTFKIWLAMNHKPIIRGTDRGIWRRIQLIPFTQSFEGREDKQIEEKLLPELPGILNWMLEGLRQWHRQGLNPPKQVTEATENYRQEMDTLGQWLDERAERGEQMRVETGLAWEDWKHWCFENNQQAGTRNGFGRRMTEHGIEKSAKLSGRFYYLKLGLLVPQVRQSEKDEKD